LLDSEKAYEDYSVIINTVGANVKEVFGEMSSAAQGAALQTNNIYNAIKQLDKDITIELENVRKRTSAWSAWYGVMKNVLEAYENLNNVSIKTLEASGSAAPYLQEKNTQAGVKTVGYGNA
jgi:hypothetical protein